MNSKSGAIAIGILGFLIGAFNLFIGVSDNMNVTFLIIGGVSIILGFGILCFWKWARIAVMFFSYMFVAIYLILIIATVTKQFDGFGAIGLMFNAPLVLLCLICLWVLSRKSVKSNFS